MVPSSRTPEGEPLRCHVCGQRSVIEPSRPPGDAICPTCGSLAWLTTATQPAPVTHSATREKSLRERFFPDRRPDPYDASRLAALRAEADRAKASRRAQVSPAVWVAFWIIIPLAILNLIHVTIVLHSG